MSEFCLSPWDVDIISDYPDDYPDDYPGFDDE